MDDPSEHALVRLALTSGLSNCVEWCNDRTANRIRNDRSLLGLTPEGIKAELIAFIRAGGTIKQVREKRGEFADFDFFYKVIIPIDDFQYGLFVEIILIDGDPDCPMVHLVNAHPQLK